MKRIFIFLLAILLLISTVPTALATNDYTQGTQVVYTATGSESYTITVPALLAPGGNGTVTLEGTWADNRIITVTAEPTVTLTNSIKAEDQKVLNVHFDGISEAGSNTGSQTFTESVSVADITNALFGTWSGKFNYNVEIVDNTAVPCATFTDGVTLSWDELKLAENGDKYSYDASAIGDTEISVFAFSHCESITNITVPDSITTVDDYAFNECPSLTRIDFSKCTNLTYIGDMSFVNCTSIASIDLSGCTSLSYIGEYIFSGCTSITSIAIPSCLSTIGYHAFVGCTSLTSIDYAGSMADWSNITLGEDWNYLCPEITVTCTDDTITIPANS